MAAGKEKKRKKGGVNENLGTSLGNLCTGRRVEVRIDEIGSKHQKFERKTSG
jgi:hypothetical protein